MSSVLVADVGNTNTRLGVWAAGTVQGLVVFPTCEAIERVTGGELPLLTSRAENAAGIALCSTVPAAEEAWRNWAASAGRDLLVIRGNTPTPLINRYRAPERLGPDRLAAAVAAVARGVAPVIVVSLGTATVVDAVSRQREYLGGAVAIGLETGLDALARNTAALPKVEAAPPAAPIGRDTEECLRAGAVLGAVGVVEELAARMRAQVGEDAPMVLTGGHAPLISQFLRSKHQVVPTLTLEGAALIWEHNRRRDEADADR